MILPKAHVLPASRLEPAMPVSLLGGGDNPRFATMMNALAPRTPRGLTWLGILLLSLSLLPASAAAQDPKSGGTPKPGGAEAKASADPKSKEDPAKPGEKDAAKAEADPNEGVAEEDIPSARGNIEVFRDPITEEALEKQKQLFRDCRPADINAIRSMAGTPGSFIDRELVHRFVQGMAYRLTDKNNLNAIVSPPPNLNMNSPAARAVAVSTESLLDALASAKLAKNTAFLNVYQRALLDNLPQLLDNHLIARIQAMIVLGQIGTPQAIPIFIAQIKDPKQTVWVKLWAFRGIANIVDGGKRTEAISVIEACTTGKVIADFLNDSEEIPWPVLVRALEALGSLRQPAMPAAPRQAEMATAVMKFLGDSEQTPEVRVTAAWAIGMMQVGSSQARFNFDLVAYNIGLVAAHLGERINVTSTANPTRSEYLAGLLVGPLHQSLNGVDSARESGLLKIPTAAPNRTYISQIADLESAISKAAVEMLRAPTGLIPEKKQALSERVGALKTLLAKSPPKEYNLMPGGPEFRPSSADLAGPREQEPAIARGR